ncbi:arginine kinase-like [Sitophilus oryzae]|uniref:arginine kinase n=1 Tax=Sitophilus oryzae TaxID=7048 RepID=A0A6J2Y587_SITOR|nr:arginine kinase-like [Sitophilus oryzae]
MSKGKCKKCEEKCGKGKASPEVLSQLELGYEKLFKSDSPSMLKRFLIKEMFDKLKFKKTSFGSTLLDCIQSGLENLDSGIGVYAADPECYSVFADLFDQIIQEYHTFSPSARQPPTDWGPSNAFGNLDPTGQFVVSTRVRCCRTLKGFPLNPCMTEDHYKEIENLMQPTFSNLSGELKGTYNPLVGMPKDVQQKLIDDHYLFKEGDRFLQAANACRFWPTGRGIYFNAKKSFLVWICEEDHLRIMSMQPGGNVGEVFGRMVNGVKEIQKNNEFVASDRFGYLTFCPTNLGTTIRASVHIKVPKLAGDMTKFKDLADKYHLQIRGAAGEHSESKDGVYDLSNKRRLGLTEYQCMKEMYDGITEIIKAEKAKK